MTQSQQPAEQTAARDPRDTGQKLANAAALANHAATHAAIQGRVIEATRQAADCTDYAAAAVHGAYDSLYAALYQGGDSHTAIQTLEQACMAADSARSATGFAARAVMRTVPPDRPNTALEHPPAEGAGAGTANHPLARGIINWDVLSPSGKSAAVWQFFFGWPAVPPEGGSPSVPDYSGDWAKAMKVRDVFACASEEQRNAFLQELIQAISEVKGEQPLSVFLDGTPEDVCVAGLRTVGFIVLRAQKRRS